MFQKIHHHLEQINVNTRLQQANSEHAEEWAEKISHQLEVLNNSVQSLEKQRPRGQGVQAASLVLAGLGLLLIGMLSMYAFRLSTMTADARDRSNASLEAYGVVNTHYQEVAGRSTSLEAKTAELDSIVRQQAQTIIELRKRNATALRNILLLQHNLLLNPNSLSTHYQPHSHP